MLLHVLAFPEQLVQNSLYLLGMKVEKKIFCPVFQTLILCVLSGSEILFSLHLCAP